MGEARNSASLREGGGQLTASRGGKDEGLRSKGPSCVRVNLSYLTPGRAACRSGQGALRFQFDVVTHVHT